MMAGGLGVFVYGVALAVYPGERTPPVVYSIVALAIVAVALGAAIRAIVAGGGDQ